MTTMVSSILFLPTGFLSLLPRRQHGIMFCRCDNNDTTTTVSQFRLELQLQIAEDYDSDGWYYYCHHQNAQQHQLHEEEEQYQEESREDIFETYYTKSIELLAQSLVMRERLLGTYHVLTGKSYYKLALVFLAMSSTRQHEGIEYEHPRTYDSITTTTAAAAASTAHWLFRDSWRIFYKLHGSSHKLTQSSYRNIIVSLLMMKFPYKAAQHYGTILHESMQLEEQGDRTMKIIQGKSDREGIYSGNDDDHSDNGKNDDTQTIDVAIKYYMKAIHLLQDDLVLLGMDGPDKAELHTKIGNCYVQRYLCHLRQICTASRGEASCTLCRQLLQCKQSLLVVVEEEEHHDENLDSWYYKDLVTACDMYSRAIDIYSRTLSENHPATIQTIDKVKEIHHLFNATYQSKGWILSKLWCRFLENVDGWFHP